MVYRTPETEGSTHHREAGAGWRGEKNCIKTVPASFLEAKRVTSTPAGTVQILGGKTIEEGWLMKVNEIIVSSARKRQLVAEKVQELAESIKELGLLQPIVVTKDKKLIAGFHRLEACKLLGWQEINCIIREYDELEAELAEIDENLIRAELTVLERAEHLRRRKEIYEAKHPEARRPQGGRRPKNSEIISPFSEATANNKDKNTLKKG